MRVMLQMRSKLNCSTIFIHCWRIHVSSMPTRRDVILVLVWPSRVHGHKVGKAVSHFGANFQLREKLRSAGQGGNVNTLDSVLFKTV